MKKFMSIFLTVCMLLSLTSFYAVRTEAASVFSPAWPFDSNYRINALDHYSSGKQHNGIDIDAARGTSVKAVYSGVVVQTNNSCSHDSKSGDTCGSGWGNFVLIKHTVNGTTYYSRYAHLKQNSITVSQNQTVSQGQVIGQSGSSGSSTGPHLHLEVYAGERTASKACQSFQYYQNNTSITSKLTFSSHVNSSSAYYGSWVASNYTLSGGVWKYAGVHTHSYSRGYEAAHPHRVYMKCSCGDYYYTGEYETISGCSECMSVSSPLLSVSKNACYVGETVAFYPSATNATGYNMRICKNNRNGETVLFKANVPNGFTWTPTEDGTYAAWCSCINAYGYVDTEIVYITVASKEITSPLLTVSKNACCVGETIKFYPSATNATSYNMRICKNDRNGETVLFESDIPNGFTWTPTEAGTYVVWCSCINAYGYVDTKDLYLTVTSDNETDTQLVCTHSYGAWTTTKAATCTATGTETRTCSLCGETETRTVDALGHNYTNGTCTRCGTADPDYVAPVVTPAVKEVHFEKQTIYFQDQFTDVPSDQWFTENVANAVEFGLMKGSSATTFKPYGDVTIAEAITMAARIHSIYTTGSENFVQTDKWYQCYLDYAYENGIISTAYYNCDVTHKATRAQFAEIFAAALPEEALGQINTIADNAVPDVKTSAAYAPSVYKLYRAGILAGGDAKGTFSPLTYITRAECATIVARMADSDNRIAFTLT